MMRSSLERRLRTLEKQIGPLPEKPPLVVYGPRDNGQLDLLFGMWDRKMWSRSSGKEPPPELTALIQKYYGRELPEQRQDTE